MWYLSPSGWPTHADSPEEQADLAGRGYAPVDEADVPAAVAAYQAGTAAPATQDPLTEAEAAAAIKGSGPLGVAAREAFLPRDEAGQLLAYKQHGPASLVTYTASATTADLDAANLSLTFTVPLSGKVEVELSGALFADASTAVEWLLRDGVATVPGTTATVRAAATGRLRAVHTFFVEGLTPGQVKTWTWAHKLPTGATGNITALAGNPAVMKVRSVPFG